MGATEARAKVVDDCIGNVKYQIGCVAIGAMGKEGIGAGGAGGAAQRVLSCFST